MTNERSNIAKQFQVRIGEADLGSRLVASRLLRRAPGKDTDRPGAEALEYIDDGASEAVAIRQQQHYCGDAPRHPQHGQKRAPEIEPHGAECLPENVTLHV